MNKDPFAIGYVAGLIDGEGNIRLPVRGGKRRLSLNIGIRNSDLDILNWLVDNYGGKIIPNRDDRPNRRPCYHWRIGVNDGVYQLLLLIQPHLRSKRHRVEEALSL